MTHLSDHFTFKKLLICTLPSIGMMIFTSLYSVVDGLFVSNFVGKTAFASINLVAPFWSIIGGFGAMLGTGGSALVAKVLGEGDTEKANRYFTMMIIVMSILGVLLSVLGITLIRPVSYLLGATDAMIEDCVVYGRTVFCFNIALQLQYTFQSFLITAEKQNFGLLITIIAGVTNMALDALFIWAFRWGVLGAALATGISQCVGGIIPLIYFFNKNNKSLLRFVKTKIELRPILKACVNGSSEMMATVSSSVIGLIYNLQLMHYVGENGVAAYGVIMYAAFIFIAIFMGYAMGSAPIVGYHNGAENHTEVKSVLRKSMVLMSVIGVIMTALALALSQPLAKLYVGYDADLMNLTVRAFRICTPYVLIAGINIFASSFFTALNNGVVSGVISFLRSLVLPVISVFVLPLLLNVDGIWLSLPVAEILALVVSIVFLLTMRKRYKY